MVAVDFDPAAPVRLFCLFGRIRENDHREFEAFAFVDAHDADHILALADDLRLGVGLVRRLHGLYIPKESVQPAVAHLLEAGGFIRDQPQVRNALRPDGQPAAVIVIARRVEDLLHQIFQRHRPADFFPHVDRADHGADLFLQRLVIALVRIGQHRAAETALPAADPDLRQLPDRESEHHGPHG